MQEMPVGVESKVSDPEFIKSIKEYTTKTAETAKITFRNNLLLMIWKRKAVINVYSIIVKILNVTNSLLVSLSNIGKTIRSTNNEEIR
jgi:hypothetical protein